MYMKLDYFSHRVTDEKSPLHKQSSQSLANPSVWVAKRQRNKVEKDLDILKNRINLLSQVENKAQKKVKEMQQKTDKILELKQTVKSIKAVLK